MKIQLLGIGAVKIILDNKMTSNILKLFFSGTFIFNGIVFFEQYTSHLISRYFYGPLFIVVGLLLFIDISRNRILFNFPQKKWLRYMTVLWLVLVYAYPMFGMFREKIPLYMYANEPMPL